HLSQRRAWLRGRRHMNTSSLALPPLRRYPRRAMRLGLISAMLSLTGLAAAASVPPPTGLDPVDPPGLEPMTPPDEESTYSPETQATIDWLEEVESARVAEKAADPPFAPPALELPLGADGIRRCVGGDGSTVFTNRSCHELGATSAPPGVASEGNTHFAPRSCARTRTALVDGVRDALDANDANRLASYYHWTGMGTRAAYALMDRLYGFAQRPLVDVQLVRGVERDRFASVGQDVPPLWSPLLPPPSILETLPPPPPPPRPPALMRVDQMHALKDVAAEVTYFHLTSNAGCWWIQY
ncbi:MAG: hypothetical protein ACREO3_05010, partial [Arenimonas sp.]